MDALQKAKALKELKTLNIDKSESSGLSKAKIIKQILELRKSLGFGVKQVADTINALYQSILDGAAITVELVEKVIEEAKKDVSHPQLRPAIIRIRDHEQELIAA